MIKELKNFVYQKKALRWALKGFQIYNRKYALTSIILFVTNKCNGKCKGCLYWSKLNRQGNKDLTLTEIRKISKSLGPVWSLQVSGGEPFLRKDLAEICKIFVDNNNTKLVSIPTNGLLTHRITKTTKRILNTCQCKLGIVLSIDGTPKANAHIRGVKNGFDKAIETFYELNKLSKSYSNLGIMINTRITNVNIDGIPRLKEMLNNRGVKAQHNIFPIRGSLKERIKPPTSKEYYNLMRNVNSDNSIMNKVRDYVTCMALDNKPWPFKCVSGKRIGVIDSDGEVRLCELLEPVGSLRKAGYNFYAIWNSKKAGEQRKLIRSGECSKGCTHGCFLWVSLMASPLKLASIVLKSRKFSL